MIFVLMVQGYHINLNLIKINLKMIIKLKIFYKYKIRKYIHSL
jgi:hypothetical protein